MGFRVLGFRVLGFGGLGFRVLGFRVLSSRFFRPANPPLPSLLWVLLEVSVIAVQNLHLQSPKPSKPRSLSPVAPRCEVQRFMFLQRSLFLTVAVRSGHRETGCNIGALMIRIGFGAHYTIIIINPKPIILES